MIKEFNEPIALTPEQQYRDDLFKDVPFVWSGKEFEAMKKRMKNADVIRYGKDGIEIIPSKKKIESSVWGTIL